MLSVRETYTGIWISLFKSLDCDQVFRAICKYHTLFRRSEMYWFSNILRNTCNSLFFLHVKTPLLLGSSSLSLNARFYLYASCFHPSSWLTGIIISFLLNFFEWFSVRVHFVWDMNEGDAINEEAHYDILLDPFDAFRIKTTNSVRIMQSTCLLHRLGQCSTRSIVYF